jgi:hypothetical protein
MKKIRKIPSREILQNHLDYNPDTGIFTRKTTFKRWSAGTVAGTMAGGYISISLSGLILRAHRIAWTYMTGDQPPLIVDHINGNTTDNRWVNLRAADPSESTTNRKRQINCKSGMKGAHKHQGRWRSRVKFRGKVFDLGTFATAEEAHAAYCAAAKIIHLDFFRPQD